MAHTSSVEKLHDYVHHQNHAVRVCTRTLLELLKTCTIDGYTLTHPYRYYLLTAVDSVLQDENILKRHENRTFEGHCLLVSIFHRSLRDLKGTRVSFKQPVLDIHDFLSGRRYPKLLEHVAAFVECCAVNFFEEQKHMATAIAVESNAVSY